MEYRLITKGASLLSVVLWLAAASFWANHGYAAFAVVALLAVLFQAIGVNSAKREGANKERRVWMVDRILDEVGR